MENLRANELRIENLVLRKAILLENNNYHEITVTHHDIEACVRSFADFEPIPLTEEWLLKFGYDLITENYYAISGHLIWICNDLFICDKNGIILKHVHQLQNLYFALTGCELEIK